MQVTRSRSHAWTGHQCRRIKSCARLWMPLSGDCNTLQHTATHVNMLQHTARRCNTRHHLVTSIAESSRVLGYECRCQVTATHCNTLKHTATHVIMPQHTATRCNTPHHLVISIAEPSTQSWLWMPLSGDCNTLQHTATLCNTL